jgi:hypothetical protein
MTASICKTAADWFYMKRESACYYYPANRRAPNDYHQTCTDTFRDKLLLATDSDKDLLIISADKLLD